jgi:DNA-binding response OmpR family regulator
MTAATSRTEAAPARRVLVAEDEFLVYLALEDELRDKGFEVLGPFTSVAEIRAAVARESIDMALLDINLGGEMIFPVADELVARNIPFIFLSGYASAVVPERYSAVPRLDKPFDPQKLLATLRGLAQSTAPGTELPAA